MRRLKLLPIFTLLTTQALWPQVASKANENYKTKDGRDGVAKTLDNPNRDKSQKPEEIIAALEVRPGMTVADIGTGTGYMLPFLSRAVGAAGKVFGEDIQNDFLDRARAKITDDKLSNTQIYLGTETDPRLPAGSVDIELVLDVYHHFDYPDKMLANLARALKPGGRLVIVDFYKKDRPDHIRLEREDVVKEIEGNGFRVTAQRDKVGNNQYMLTFVKR
jgi:ubiquinone/menaquinone biosynthesis C-methylase UbiE